jgi:hypothetical protein
MESGIPLFNASRFEKAHHLRFPHPGRFIKPNDSPISKLTIKLLHPRSASAAVGSRFGGIIAPAGLRRACNHLTSHLQSLEILAGCLVAARCSLLHAPVPCSSALGRRWPADSFGTDDTDGWIRMIPTSVES